MAFSFFKKKNHADRLFINARLVTEDEELESCTWLAVKDGRIMAIGEEDTWEDLKGKETDVVDLYGKYLSPGLIEAFGDPADAIFSDISLKADPSWDLETLMEHIEGYAEEHKDEGFCFVTGAGMQLFGGPRSRGAAEDEPDDEEGEDLPEEVEEAPEESEDAAEEASEEAPEAGAEEGSSPAVSFTDALDEACKGLPTVIMFEDGLSLRLSSSAAEMVTARADEIGARTISPELALDTVVAVDYSSRALPLMSCAMEMAEKGCTAVFGTPSSSFTGKLYKDLVIDQISCGLLKQRYFGSTVFERMVAPSTVMYMMNRARTECTELDGNMLYDTIVLRTSSDTSSFRYFKPEYMARILEDAADRGFSARVYALDRQAALSALEIMGDVSSRYKKQSFILFTQEVLTEDEMSGLFTGSVVIYPMPRPEEKAGEDGWLQKTAEAARDCGVRHMVGYLEEGMTADLAVFDEDPRSAASPLKAYMTVLSGEPVYIRGTSSLDDWTNAMKEQLEGFAADFDIPVEEAEE